MEFVGEDPNVSGYIFDGPSIISIDKPRLEGLNKYAYDVIKTQVMDHFEEVGASGDGEKDIDVDKLKVNLFDLLRAKLAESVARKKSSLLAN